MLAIVVRLEERDAQIQLEQYATDWPHVARLVPAQFEDYLGRTVVASGHDRRVMLVVECRWAEINQLDARGFNTLQISLLILDRDAN